MLCVCVHSPWYTESEVITPPCPRTLILSFKSAEKHFCFAYGGRSGCFTVGLCGFGSCQLHIKYSLLCVWSIKSIASEWWVCRIRWIFSKEVSCSDSFCSPWNKTKVCWASDDLGVTLGPCPPPPPCPLCTVSLRLWLSHRFSSLWLAGVQGPASTSRTRLRGNKTAW